MPHIYHNDRRIILLQKASKAIRRAGFLKAPCYLDEEGRVVAPSDNHRGGLNRSFVPSLGQYLLPPDIERAIKALGCKSAASHLGAHSKMTKENYVRKLKLLLWFDEREKLASQIRHSHFENCTLTQLGAYCIFRITNKSKYNPINFRDPVVLEMSPRKTPIFAMVASSGDVDKTVILKLNTVLDGGTEGKTFDITFGTSSLVYRRCHYALDLLTQWPEWRWNMLFPGSSGHLQPLEPLIDRSHLECSRNADATQKCAIDAIVASTYRPWPFILFGPPGTGKTGTVIECIDRIVCEELPVVKVLVVASTNSYINVLARGFAENKPHQIEHTVRYTVNPLSQLEYFEHDEIMSRIICDQEQLVDRLESCKVVFTTCITAFTLAGLQIGFDYVIIDEASQVNEPIALIPISLLNERGSLILVGDPQQLGPYVHIECSKNGLQTSLLERLLETEAYKSSLEAGDNKLVTMLKKCYRCDQRILATTNELIYRGKLELSFFTPKLWLKKLGVKKPLLFVDVPGTQEVGKCHSSFNLEEANECVKIVRILKSQIKIELEKITIITFYTEQMNMLYKRLTACHLDGPEVSVVECFQGNESDVVIISTVLDKANNCFASDLRRINVATSRARYLSIIVGRTTILRQNGLWGAILNGADKLYTRML